MKLNLESGNDLRNGYVNVNLGIVDLKSVPQNTRFVVGNFRNLDPIVKDGQAEEIVFNPPFNRIGPAEAMKVLTHWKNKLGVGGVLKLVFCDIRRLGQILHSGEIPLQEAHSLIFGSPNAPHQSLIDAQIMKNIGESLGLSVKSISAKDYVVTIELEKNAEN
jgi:hypothetical protein